MKTHSYPRGLFFICSTASVAERLAQMVIAGTVASIYQDQKAAAAAYRNYPASLRYRYGVFETCINSDGVVAYTHEIIP